MKTGLKSELAWLDYSDSERRKVLEVVELFKERDTRDELGLGSVRDAIADLLSPGTSTIQTRARYFLLIPWTYQRIERQGRRSTNVAERARRAECELIDILASSDDAYQTIGQRARSGLQRLPSTVYWQGLAVWGIRSFPGSQEQYHQWLDLGGPRSLEAAVEIEDPEAPVEVSLGAWHPGLPDAPEDFPTGESLRLTAVESDYLVERLRSRAPGTLLDFLVTRGEAWQRVDFAWEHAQLGEFPSAVQEQLHHGRCFSEALHGAALTYNLMLAEARESQEWATGYRDWIGEWAVELGERQPVLENWDRSRFWEIVKAGGARITPQTQQPVGGWLDLVIGRDASAVADTREARELIGIRERQLKRGQARLANRRALEMWGGEAGTAQLNYRWSITQQHALDILRGRQTKHGNASA